MFWGRSKKNEEIGKKRNLGIRENVYQLFLSYGVALASRLSKRAKCEQIQQVLLPIPLARTKRRSVVLVLSRHICAGQKWIEQLPHLTCSTPDAMAFTRGQLVWAFLAKPYSISTRATSLFDVT
jgi:hypothetical protein